MSGPPSLQGCDAPLSGQGSWLGALEELSIVIEERIVDSDCSVGCTIAEWPTGKETIPFGLLFATGQKSLASLWVTNLRVSMSQRLGCNQYHVAKDTCDVILVDLLDSPVTQEGQAVALCCISKFFVIVLSSIPL